MTVPTVTVLAAGLLAACSSLPGSQRRVCVDPHQNVISEQQCTQPGGIGRYYYYSGSGSSFSSFGSHASGGGFSSGAAASASAASVGRGGFGGAGHGAAE